MNWEKTGIFTEEELKVVTPPRLKKRLAVFECLQEIPCDACLEACKFDAVKMEDINASPRVIFENCTGCMKCAFACPGLAVFLVDYRFETPRLTLPYEVLPVPKKGDEVLLLNRVGEEIGKGRVLQVLGSKKNKTKLITVEVEEGLEMRVRNIKVVK